MERNYRNFSLIDEKLIKICSEYFAKRLTPDYDLNKLSKFYGVEALNITKLFLALRPSAMSGEPLYSIGYEGRERERTGGWLFRGWHLWW